MLVVSLECKKILNIRLLEKLLILLCLPYHDHIKNRLCSARKAIDGVELVHEELQEVDQVLLLVYNDIDIPML